MFSRLLSIIDRHIVILIQIFVLGLLLHFLGHTIVSYQFMRDSNRMQLLRLRKEFWLLCFALYVLSKRIVRLGGWRAMSAHIVRYCLYPVAYTTKHQHYVDFLRLFVAWLCRWIVVGIMIFWIGALVVAALHDASLLSFVASMKYSFIGFVILILGITGGLVLSQQQSQTVLRRSAGLMMWVLIAALIWFLVIKTDPYLLQKLGYDATICEAVIGQAPPATYRTDLCFGTVRNQFVFERPTTFGFRLIAWRPLFVLLWLRPRKLEDILHRWILFAIVLLTTFARSALIARIVQITVLGGILRHRYLRRFLIFGLIPVLIGFVGLGWLMYDDLVVRSFSTIGHVQETLKALIKIGQSPVIGRGPGFAGPASHQLASQGILPYNPENQYLQLMVEYGVIVGGVWSLVIVGLVWIGLWPAVVLVRRYSTLLSRKRRHELPAELRALLGCSLGVLGLAIAGLVLHSRADRMVIYPLMLMMGIAIAQVIRSEQ